MRTFRWTIKRKLLALGGVTCVVAAGVLGSWIWVEYRERFAVAERELALISLQGAGQVRGVVDVAIRTLQVLAVEARVENGDLASMRRALQATAMDQPDIANVVAVAADGRLIASGIPSPESATVSLADRPWFREVMTTGRPAVGGYHEVGRVTGKPGVSIAIPVGSHEGRSTRVLALALNLEWLQRLFQALPLGPGMTITVLDGERRVLAHFPGAGRRPGDTVRLPQPVPVAPAVATVPGVDGLPLMSAVAPVRGTRWVVLASVRRADVRREVASLVMPIASVSLLLLAVVYGVGLLMALRIWRPIQALTEATKRVPGNEPPGPLPVESNDDVGELARAFTAMAADVADAREEIEARLLETTTSEVVGRLLTETLELPVVLGRLSEIARTRLDADVVRVWLTGDAPGVFDLGAQTGEAQAPVHRQIRPGSPKGLIAWIAERLVPVVIEDLDRDERTGDREWVRREGLVSLLGVPVVMADVAVGVLIVMTRRPRRFTPNDVSLAEAIALPAGISIRNARQYEAQVRSRAEAEALLGITRATTTAGVRELLRDLCRSTAALCGAHRATILLRDAERGRFLPAMSQLAIGKDLEVDWRRFRSMATKSVLVAPALAELVGKRAPMRSDDVRGTGLIEETWVDAFTLRSVVGVPLVAGDAVIGVMVLDSGAEVRPFTDRQVDLATAAAGHVALLVQKAELFDEIQRRLTQTEAHLEIACALGSTSDLRSALKAIAIQSARACEMDRCSIFLWQGERAVPAMSQFADGRENTALWQVFLQIETRPAETAETIPFVHEAVERRQPLVIDRPGDDPRVPPALALCDFKALLVLPLVHGERVLGVLVLDNNERLSPVEPAQISIATSIAGQAALTIENAQLNEELRLRAAELEQRGHQLALLHDAARTLGAEHDLPTLLQRLVDTAQRLLGCRYGALATLDDDGRIGRFLTAGVTEEERRRVQASPEGRGVLGRVLRQGELIRLDDVSQHPSASGFPPGHPAIRSLLAAPIAVHGRVVGALYLAEAAGGFTAADATMLTTLCADAAMAIDNARLLAAEQARRLEADTLLRLALLTGSILDEKELFRRIVVETASACGADRCSIYVLDASTGHVVPVMSQFVDGGRDPAMWRAFKAQAKLSLDELPFFREAIERRQPLLVPTASDPCIPPGWADLYRIRSMLAVPLFHGDAALGLLTLSLTRDDAAFTPEQVRLATSIAAQVVLSIENARLVKDLRQTVEDLRRAQDQLVQTETLRALGEMAAGVAHHLNNLLTIVLGRTQLLLERSQDRELQRALTIVEQAAKDGASVVRRIHGFSRLQPASEMAPVDLNRLARDVIALTRARWSDDALARGIDIQVELDAGAIAPVDGEPSALREVLVNLVLNAVDALPDGGRITVRTRQERDQVVCAVIDTGTGMTGEVQRRALEPFFTTKGPKSTGLGLSVNYGIVRGHGGVIEIDSVAGRGTTVRFRLPASTRSRPSEAARAPDQAAPLRILLVDDEEAVRATLADLLQARGHDVVVAEGGHAAIAILEGGAAIDLVLTDLGMPEMTGREVAEVVRERWPSILIGLVTGWGERATSDIGITSVADFVVGKPPASAELAAAIAAAVARRTPR